MSLRVTVVSASMDPESRSRIVAREAARLLGGHGVAVEFFDLREHRLPEQDASNGLYEDPVVARLKRAVVESDGVVLASPIYNWQLSSSLKRCVEVLGGHDPSHGIYAAWLDKVVTFACAGGLHHSYMAYGPMAASMMMDFKCVINPYMVYAVGADCEGEAVLGAGLRRRLEKTLAVKVELMERLQGRTYRSSWEV